MNFIYMMGKLYCQNTIAGILSFKKLGETQKKTIKIVKENWELCLNRQNGQKPTQFL